MIRTTSLLSIRSTLLAKGGFAHDHGTIGTNVFGTIGANVILPYAGECGGGFKDHDGAAVLAIFGVMPIDIAEELLGFFVVAVGSESDGVRADIEDAGPSVDAGHREGREEVIFGNLPYHFRCQLP